MTNTHFVELSRDEMILTDGGLIPLLVFGVSIIGLTMANRESIAKGLVDGYISVVGI